MEFEFTPYTGDLKEDHVETVAGKGQVFTNNVLIADRDIRKEMVPVLRKGRNSIRIEFQPSDGKAPYHGRRARST